MKKQRIYVDTSVIGGCFDAEFEEWSNRLFEPFRYEKFAAIVSAVTAAEVEHAPVPVQNLYAELIDAGAELLTVSMEALTLLDKYSERKILGRRF